MNDQAWRYRINVGYTSRGAPTFDCTVEGPDRAAVEIESDSWVARLRQKYGPQDQDLALALEQSVETLANVKRLNDVFEVTQALQEQIDTLAGSVKVLQELRDSDHRELWATKDALRRAVGVGP